MLNAAKDREDLSYGLLVSGADLEYCPPQILDKMPRYVPVGSSALAFFTAEAAGAWQEYYKTLNSFGINHNEPESISRLFTDAALRAKVEEAFAQVMG